LYKSAPFQEQSSNLVRSTGSHFKCLYSDLVASSIFCEMSNWRDNIKLGIETGNNSHSQRWEITLISWITNYKLLCFASLGRNYKLQITCPRKSHDGLQITNYFQNFFSNYKLQITSETLGRNYKLQITVIQLQMKLPNYLTAFNAKISTFKPRLGPEITVRKASKPFSDYFSL
jgi:hypothetical protein